MALHIWSKLCWNKQVYTLTFHTTTIHVNIHIQMYAAIDIRLYMVHVVGLCCQDQARERKMEKREVATRDRRFNN